MSHWKQLPPNGGIHSFLNAKFGEHDPAHIVYPHLNDGSDLVLASDYSGEHQDAEFRVLGFLLTTQKSIENIWDPARREVRQKFLKDDRRMSFKKLRDGARINAFPTFLKAASELNGILLCVGVEKSFQFATKENLQPLQYDWVPGPLEKLVEICTFGAALVNGLRTPGQNLIWLTDDDAIVVKDQAKADARTLMTACLYSYPDEKPNLAIGVASEFTEDGLAVEDLLAIPDLAAGAYSETLTRMGKANMPTSGSGPGGHALFLQPKSTLINGFLGDKNSPLQTISTLVRCEPRPMLLSFGRPFVRLPKPGESTEGSVPIDDKWRKSLEAELKRTGVDPDEILKEMGIKK